MSELSIKDEIANLIEQTNAELAKLDKVWRNYNDRFERGQAYGIQSTRVFYRNRLQEILDKQC